MKIAAITGPRLAALVNSDDLKAQDGYALVKVHAAPMCAEYKGFLSGERSQSLGHEAAGEVVEVSRGSSSRVQPGQRVVVMPLYPCGRCEHCLGGRFIFCLHQQDVPGKATYAQFLLKADWLLPSIPDGVSYEHASMACCGLGPTFGAMDEINLNCFDTLLITGAGPVGLGGVINAKYRGCKRVLVVEGNEYRAKKALSLGATAVYDPVQPDLLKTILDTTQGLGVDKAIDCSGVPAAHRLCIDATRRLGHVAFVGESYAFGPTELYVSPDMIRKGLTLHGCWHYSLDRFDALMQVIRSRPQQLDELITHRLPMSRVQEAFEISASGQCGKIVLDPWG